MKRTLATLRVAEALLDHPEDQHIYGYPVCRHTGMRPGVVYPILHRMLEAGWLADGWEENPPGGRPPRRYYKITEKGRAELRKLLDRVDQNM